MRLRLFAAAIAVLASSLAAHADTFVFTPDNGTAITFSTDGLTPSVYTTDNNAIEYDSDSVTIVAYGASEAAAYSIFGYGNFDLRFYAGGVRYFEDGPQLFAGDLATSTPTFIAGTYTLVADPQSENTIGGTLVITGDAPAATPSATAVTPEPSSLALLGTGLLGLAGAVRRRLVA